MLLRKITHAMRLLAFLSLPFLAASAHGGAEPLAQDFTVVFHNPDRERYVEGPGLVRLDDGALLAAVPVVPREEWSKERRLTQRTTHVLRSDDHGKTWRELAELPFYSAAPWTHRGTLYLFANKPGPPKARNEDLLILRSDDAGRTWSEPVTLFRGNYWNCHTAMVQRADRLYWAIDDLALGAKRGPRLLAGDLSGDVLDPSSWRLSEPVKFPGAPKEMFDAKFAGQPDQYLEPNVIEVNGRLRVLSVVKIKRQTDGQCLRRPGRHRRWHEARSAIHALQCDARRQPEVLRAVGRGIEALLGDLQSARRQREYDRGEAGEFPRQRGRPTLSHAALQPRWAELVFCGLYRAQRRSSRSPSCMRGP